MQRIQGQQNAGPRGFSKLELDGLIDIIPNRGAFVIGITHQDIEDMYELRKAYEAIAVKWAIERITAEEFQELEEAYDIMEFYTQKVKPTKCFRSIRTSIT